MPAIDSCNSKATQHNECKEKATSKRSASYEQELLASLKNPDEALAYLRVSFQDDDPRVFLTALRRVAQANGGFTELAARTGNPKLGNIETVPRSFGMKLTVERVG